LGSSANRESAEAHDAEKTPPHFVREHRRARLEHALLRYVAVATSRQPFASALLRLRSLATRFIFAIWRGPIARNLGGTVGAQLCVLVSGTIAARLLGPQIRGYLAILTAWPSAVGQIGAVGMSLAATYFLSSNQIGGSELLALLRRPVSIQIAVLTLLNTCIILGYTLISGAPILFAACISLAQLPVAIGADYGYAFLLGTRRHGTVNAFRSLIPGLYAAALVVLYVVHVRSLAITVTCLVASSVFGGVVVLLTGMRDVRRVQSTKSIVATLGPREARKKILAFGRRGYIGYLSPVDTFRIDQLVVGFLVSPRALGFYVVGAAFTNFARGLAINVGLSSTPEIAAHAAPQERLHAVRRTLLLSAGVLTIITVALAPLVIVAIPVLFGKQYRSSIPIAEILFVAGWLLSMKRIAVDSMRGAGEAQVGTHAEIVNLVLFLVACGPLGLLLGGLGVALALVFASAGGSVVLVRRLHRLGII
jgi:O-antigen/teichoic acid export membrane protein